MMMTTSLNAQAVGYETDDLDAVGWQQVRPHRAGALVERPVGVDADIQACLGQDEGQRA